MIPKTTAEDASIMSDNSSATLQASIVDEKELDSPMIADRIDPDATPPTQVEIDIIRFTWERISEIHLPTDPVNVSPTHAFGLAFYDALFQLDPSLERLFSDIFLQAKALAGMIAYIVRTPKVTGSKCPFKGAEEEKELSIREINALKKREYATDNFQALVASVSQSPRKLEDDDGNSMNTLLQKLRELGARHYLYGVRLHHLSLVGPAVLSALKSRLGKEFLPEVADAWARAYAYIGYHMGLGLQAQENWSKGQKKAANKKMNINIHSRHSKSSCILQ